MLTRTLQKILTFFRQRKALFWLWFKRKTPETTNNMNTIDCHAHIFNLRYLPVAGIIRRYSKNIVPHEVAVGVERFLLTFTGADLGTSKSTLFTSTPGSQNILVYDDSTASSLPEIVYDNEPLFEISQEALVNALAHHFSPEHLEYPEILEALSSEFVSDGQRKTLFASKSLSGMPTPSSFISKAYEAEAKRAINIMFNKVINAMESGLNHFRWFVFMMNSERKILNRLRTRDGNGIHKYLCLTMDVDSYFSENDLYGSYYDFVKEQIPRMSAILKANPDLIGFVAFNPDQPDYLAIVKNAISHHGFAGVKFYPPMGYHFGHKNTEVAKRVHELLKYCHDKDIPLFTHCNNSGFQAFPAENSGYRSNPKHWDKALQIYPNLRLCLGHAGGGDGWFCDHQAGDVSHADDIQMGWVKNDSVAQRNWNNSYAAQVFRLCVKYDNVYCDASYLDEMVGPGNNPGKMAANFKKRLLLLFNHNPEFATKILYGSDWHMLYREAKNETYFMTYLEFFNDADLVKYKADFFENNAKRYLKLP